MRRFDLSGLDGSVSFDKWTVKKCTSGSWSYTRSEFTESQLTAISFLQRGQEVINISFEFASKEAADNALKSLSIHGNIVKKNVSVSENILSCESDNKVMLGCILSRFIGLQGLDVLVIQDIQQKMGLTDSHKYLYEALPVLSARTGKDFKAPCVRLAISLHQSGNKKDAFYYLGRSLREIGCIEEAAYVLCQAPKKNSSLFSPVYEEQSKTRKAIIEQARIALGYEEKPSAELDEEVREEKSFSGLDEDEEANDDNNTNLRRLFFRLFRIATNEKRMNFGDHGTSGSLLDELFHRLTVGEKGQALASDINTPQALLKLGKALVLERDRVVQLEKRMAEPERSLERQTSSSSIDKASPNTQKIRFFEQDGHKMPLSEDKKDASFDSWRVDKNNNKCYERSEADTETQLKGIFWTYKEFGEIEVSFQFASKEAAKKAFDSLCTEEDTVEEGLSVSEGCLYCRGFGKKEIARALDRFIGFQGLDVLIIQDIKQNMGLMYSYRDLVTISKNSETTAIRLTRYFHQLKNKDAFYHLGRFFKEKDIIKKAFDFFSQVPQESFFYMEAIIKQAEIILKLSPDDTPHQDVLKLYREGNKDALYSLGCFFEERNDMTKALYLLSQVPQESSLYRKAIIRQAEIRIALPPGEGDVHLEHAFALLFRVSQMESEETYAKRLLENLFQKKLFSESSDSNNQDDPNNLLELLFHRLTVGSGLQPEFRDIASPETLLELAKKLVAARVEVAKLEKQLEQKPEQVNADSDKSSVQLT